MTASFASLYFLSFRTTEYLETNKPAVSISDVPKSVSIDILKKKTILGIRHISGVDVSCSHFDTASNFMFCLYL